jgi:hypothetical protein
MERKHYLDNKEFSKAVVEYVDRCNEARENEQPLPQVTDYIAESFMAISSKLSNRSNFARYTYKDEMVMDGVENCLRAIGNYRYDYVTRTGLPNAFSYFTQICFYAFVRRIQKENKQLDIKNEFALKADHQNFVHYGETGLDPTSFSLEDSISEQREKIRVIEHAKKVMKKPVAPRRRRIRGIEKFYC